MMLISQNYKSTYNQIANVQKYIFAENLTVRSECEAEWSKGVKNWKHSELIQGGWNRDKKIANLVFSLFSILTNATKSASFDIQFGPMKVLS